MARTMDETFAALMAAVSPALDRASIGMLWGDYDAGDEVDNFEAAMATAVDHDITLPADLVDDLERIVPALPMRDPQPALVDRYLAQLRQRSAVTA